MQPPARDSRAGGEVRYSLWVPLTAEIPYCTYPGADLWYSAKQRAAAKRQALRNPGARHLERPQLAKHLKGTEHSVYEQRQLNALTVKSEAQLDQILHVSLRANRADKQHHEASARAARTAAPLRKSQQQQAWPVAG